MLLHKSTIVSIYCLFLQLGGFTNSAAQQVSGLRTDSKEWTRQYKQKLDSFLSNTKNWKTGVAMHEPDAGKWNWPVLLTKIYQHKTDSLHFFHWVKEEGKKLQDGPYSGSFYKPFSCVGYAHFFFECLPHLEKVQKQKLYDALYKKDWKGDTGWNYLVRKDHQMDPIYSFTEFNSENFRWMMRCAGYLFAHHFKDEMRIRYFDTAIDNWVRAIYNAGRVEWESNLYFGYCFTPALTLRQYAKDISARKKAEAVMDWMLLDAAIHYLDGVQTGPDVRAKSNAYKAFDGSAWFWTYLYFADSLHHPSFSAQQAFRKVPPQMLGHALYSSYRPLQVAVDIAQRKFKTPVEMRNARPFYGIDNNNYQDWKGNTKMSRRFEFETLYLEQDYTLGSVATERPDAKAAMQTQKGFFSEQSVWRLAIRGRDKGAVQIFGNAGDHQDDAGRWPYEQIGQFRNVMLRLVQHTERLWIVLPANSETVQENNQLFADLGSGVYVAFTPLHEKKLSIQLYSQDSFYQQYQWAYDTADIGALAMEVGTLKEDGSFVQFQTAIQNKMQIKQMASGKVQYVSRQGHMLEMAHQPAGAYTLADGSIWRPAGALSRLWVNGKFIDYKTWNAFQVVHGEKILTQQWGKGELQASVKGKSVQIKVDDKTAMPQWHSLKR